MNLNTIYGILCLMIMGLYIIGIFQKMEIDSEFILAGFAGAYFLISMAFMNISKEEDRLERKRR